MSRVYRFLGLDTPRPDWVVELPEEIGRMGEPIRTRINATHLDRVLRQWQPTLVRQWRNVPYRRVSA